MSATDGAIGYVLELENGKYYVGTTRNLEARFEEHRIGDGSAWTVKHKPIKIISTFDVQDGSEEDRYTLKMMKKYGMDLVRGGSYTNVKLSDRQKTVLTDKLSPPRGKCFACGEHGHHQDACEDHERQSKIEKRTVENTCFRCGREGHYASSCYAKISKSSTDYDDCDDCYDFDDDY